MNYPRSRQKAKTLPGTAIIGAGTRVLINGAEYALTAAAHIEATEITVVPVADLYAFWNLSLWRRLVWLLTGRLK